MIRGVQWYHGRLIAYSLGNLAGWRTFAMGGTLSESAIITVTLHADGSVARAHWTALTLQSPGTPVPDPGEGEPAPRRSTVAGGLRRVGGNVRGRRLDPRSAEALGAVNVGFAPWT